jgi:hypothetical protein
MMKRPRLRAAVLVPALMAALVTGVAGAGSAVAGAGAARADEKTCSLAVKGPELTGYLNRKVSFRATVTCTDVAFVIRTWVWLNQRGHRGESPYSESHLVDYHHLGASLPCAVGWYDASARGQWEIGRTIHQEYKAGVSIYVEDCG